jgi:hypothetical protein
MKNLKDNVVVFDGTSHFVCPSNEVADEEVIDSFDDMEEAFDLADDLNDKC